MVLRLDIRPLADEENRSFAVLSGRVTIGVIREARSATDGFWVWSITAVPAVILGAGPGHGTAPSFEAAVEAFSGRWQRFLETADLAVREGAAAGSGAAGQGHRR
jgi:hypothetical protein